MARSCGENDVRMPQNGFEENGHSSISSPYCVITTPKLGGMNFVSLLSLSCLCFFSRLCLVLVLFGLRHVVVFSFICLIVVIVVFVLSLPLSRFCLV